MTEKEVVRVQAIIRGFLAKQKAKKLRKNHKYRQSVINELTVTEVAYMQNLETVVVHVLTQLKKQTGNSRIVNSKDIELLFSNIEALL